MTKVCIKKIAAGVLLLTAQSAFAKVDCSKIKPFKLVKTYQFNVKVEVEKKYPDTINNILFEINKVVPLKVGEYDAVSYISAAGVQNFHPLKGSAGSQAGLSGLQTYETKEISFSIPREEKLRDEVLKAIAFAHPYEEPVITIVESTETRTNPEFKKAGACDTSPHKWWRRK
jgi:hypothetical protein